MIHETGSLYSMLVRVVPNYKRYERAYVTGRKNKFSSNTFFDNVRKDMLFRTMPIHLQI